KSLSGCLFAFHAAVLVGISSLAQGQWMGANPLYETSGKVGINTTSPGAWLTVGSSSASGDPGPNVGTPTLGLFIQGTTASPVASTDPALTIVSNANGAIAPTLAPQAEVEIVSYRSNGDAGGLGAYAYPQTAGYQGLGSYG